MPYKILPMLTDGTYFTTPGNVTKPWHLWTSGQVERTPYKFICKTRTEEP